MCGDLLLVRVFVEMPWGLNFYNRKNEGFLTTKRAFCHQKTQPPRCNVNYPL